MSKGLLQAEGVSRVLLVPSCARNLSVGLGLFALGAMRTPWRKTALRTQQAANENRPKRRSVKHGGGFKKKLCRAEACLALASFLLARV